MLIEQQIGHYLHCLLIATYGQSGTAISKIESVSTNKISSSKLYIYGNWVMVTDVLLMLCQIANFIVHENLLHRQPHVIGL